jgi:hypothetical protein
VNLFALIPPNKNKEPFSLSPAEQLLYFKLFFEADGAAWIGFLRYVTDHGELSHATAMETSIVEHIFSQILSSYLALTNNTPDRVELRREMQKLERGYRNKSRQHKLHLHMQTLFRVGLVERLDAADGIRYRLRDGGAGLSSAHRFLSEVPDYVALERKAAQQQWLDVAAVCLERAVTCADLSDDGMRAFALGALADFYQRAVSHGLMFGPIESLLNAVQIEGFVKLHLVFPYPELMRVLEQEQRESPRDVRFHVDRLGRPAFVKASNEWLGRHLSVA